MATKKKADAGKPQRSPYSEEQRKAIERHVSAELRWVAGHEFMGNAASSEEYGTGKEWRDAARRRGPAPCPSSQALNILAWAIKSADKFWSEFHRRCDLALKRHDLEKERKLAHVDTPDKLVALKQSLDRYLADHGLSRSTMPPPKFSD